MPTWNIPLLILQVQADQVQDVPTWDDKSVPPPPPPSRHQMSFSDLQQSLHDVNTGKSRDNAFRNNVLVTVILVAVLALVIHLYKRHKHGAAPDSMKRLGWELGRLVRFPLGTRLLLKWVARSTQTPLASLLLSAALFDRCVKEWGGQPTFSVARQWGRARLARLRPVLFDEPGR